MKIEFHQVTHIVDIKNSNVKRVVDSDFLSLVRQVWESSDGSCVIVLIGDVGGAYDLANNTYIAGDYVNVQVLILNDHALNPIGEIMDGWNDWFSSIILCEQDGVAAFIVKEAMDIVRGYEDAGSRYGLSMHIKRLFQQLNPAAQAACLHKFQEYKDNSWSQA